MSWQKGIWEEVFGEPWSRDSQERVTRQYLLNALKAREDPVSCATQGCGHTAEEHDYSNLSADFAPCLHEGCKGSPTGVAPCEDFEEPES